MEGAPRDEEENHDTNCKLLFCMNSTTPDIIQFSRLTQHPDGLLPVIRGLGHALLVGAPVGRPPKVAAVSLPDGQDHPHVEECQEDDRDEEEYQE